MLQAPILLILLALCSKKCNKLVPPIIQCTKYLNFHFSHACHFLCSFQYREERFRQTSESTNQRVLWWSIAQTLILVATGFWQMRHLKGFFEAKKLV